MDFKQRMTSGELLYGAMLTLPSPTIAEVLVDIGFDWFFIDGEHGALETADFLQVLQTVGHKMTCLVRVPEASEVAIKKVLDLGAHGIIVPQVNDRETVENIVRWAKYPPLGSRGVGLARAHGYGSQFQDYVEHANDRLIVMVQAEHRDAVEEIESIVSVPGLDAIQLGPYDLSASMGKMGEIDSPEVAAALDKICSACQAANLPISSFGVTDESLARDVKRGVTLLCAGTDSLYLASGAKRMLDRVRIV